MNHLPPRLLKSANLWTYKIFDICGPSACGATCRFEICGPNTFCYLRICWPKFIADLQLPQIWEFFIFLLTNTYLKCSNSIFYQIKISAKQTCSWLLDSFAIKGGNFFKKILSYGGKFADWQFADWLTNKICGFAICGSIKRNLRTCISQKFADLWLRIKPKNLRILKKQFLDHLCTFTQGLGGNWFMKKTWSRKTPGTVPLNFLLQ